MSTAKKPSKITEDLQNALQTLIAKGKKEGILRSSELNGYLEKMDLSPERIEEIYDRIEAMNIQIVGAEMELDPDEGLPFVDDLGEDIDLSTVEDEELVDPVGLAAEYNLDDPVRMYLKEIGQIKLTLIKM